MIKAVIFDMDGVLIEAKEWHYDALNEALAFFGFTITREEHLTSYDGLPTKKKLSMLSSGKGFPVALHNFINQLKQKITMKIVHQNCTPNFAHEYALSRLQREGYKLAVASNSVKNSVSVMMELSNLSKYLEFQMSNEDVKNGKPDPEIYNKSILKLELSPKEVLIVEDNVNGIKAARASGAFVMEVNSIDDVNYDAIKSFISKLETNC